jgi:hypothetical protein
MTGFRVDLAANMLGRILLDMPQQRTIHDSAQRASGQRSLHHMKSSSKRSVYESQGRGVNGGE